MKEIWKDIKGYEGLYQAGTMGNIKSLRKDIVMNSYDDGNGYLKLTLYDKNKNRASKKVHRLIAETFIDNPDMKPCTNHKNGNRSDNRVENLEWFTYSENAIHGFRELGRVNTWKNKFGKNHNRSKAVVQYSKKGELIGSYGSIAEAERETGIARGTISNNINGVHRSKYGYIWKYA